MSKLIVKRRLLSAALAGAIICGGTYSSVAWGRDLEILSQSRVIPHDTADGRPLQGGTTSNADMPAILGSAIGHGVLWLKASNEVGMGRLNP